MRHPGRTPPFRTATGEIVSGSIVEIGYQRLGGVDQWVVIRGESLTNPALERSFTVVCWDQRAPVSHSPATPLDRR